MKNRDLISRCAFFTIIGALLLYYLQLHIYYSYYNYQPGEDELKNSNIYLLPAILFETAFIVLLWSMLRRMGLDTFTKIFATGLVIVFGAIPSCLSTMVIDWIGTNLHLHNENDPFLLYALLAAIYATTEIIAIRKQYKGLEGATYFALLMHSCGFFLYRLVLGVDFNIGGGGVGPT